MRRALIVLPAMCLALAACSSSAKSATSTTTAPTTTTATTTSDATATTISAPTTTIATATTTAVTAATLPGGIASTIQESAYIVSVDTTAKTITIDPMEYLTGGPANAAFRQANPTATIKTPPDDYFIVNPTKDHVVLPLDSTFDAELVNTGGTTHNPAVSVPLAQLASQQNLDARPFWITVERGVAIRAVEQFVP